MVLTTEQRAIFSGLEVILTQSLVGMVTACLWYGVFIVLLPLSIALHLKRDERTFARNVLFAVTVIGFALASIYVGCRIGTVFIVLDCGLVNNSGVPLEALLVFISEKLAIENVLIVWGAIVPALIVDGTLIWRVWALCKYTQNRWIIVFPCLIWLGTLGTTLSFVIWLCTPSGFNTYLRTHIIGGNLLTVGASLSNLTNLVATTMFGWILWSLKRQGKGFEVGMPQSPIRRSMTILIESGTLYFIVQVLYLGFSSGPSRNISMRYFSFVLASTYAVLAAMYPTILTVLTELKLSSSEAILTSFKLTTTNTGGNMEMPNNAQPQDNYTHQIPLVNLPQRSLRFEDIQVEQRFAHNGL